MKKNILFAMILAVAMLASNCINQQNPGTIETGENIAVVSTQHGDVRGYIDDGIYAFKAFYVSDKCKNHRKCIGTFTCPAFSIQGDFPVIDPDTCVGCAVCAQICPENAILPLKK